MRIVGQKADAVGLGAVEERSEEAIADWGSYDLPLQDAACATTRCLKEGVFDAAKLVRRELGDEGHVMCGGDG